MSFDPDSYLLPAIPVSVGALVFDQAGRLLILRPTYKSGWTIPGGVMEADGETPWDACRREVAEECGISVTTGRLVCVDTRPAKPNKKRGLGLRMLFHCGTVDDATLSGIVLQEEEISAYRLAEPSQAVELLRPAVGRRVGAVLGTTGCRYLEDGRALDAVQPA